MHLIQAVPRACAPLAVLFLLTGASVRAATPKPVDFAHDIVPILKARCGECHTNGTYKGKLSLDTREELLGARVVEVGKSGQSELIQRILDPDPAGRMPPKGSPLPEKEVTLLRRWIDEGLRWEPGFSFKARKYVATLAPRRPALPPAHAGRTNPVDRIIDAYLTTRKLPIPPRVEDAALLRRAHLDVIGMLPTVAELEAFLADQNPDKRARLADRLLARERDHAEHWLTFWNDLLRNDYQGTGYIDGGRKPITAWLYQALLENRPYDVMVRELIHPSPASEGFINGIKWRGNVNASQTREVQFAQNISQVFLGINMKCASCHDSFIDDWKLEDAYGLAAVISASPLEIHRCDKPTGKTAVVKFLFPELGRIDGSLPPQKRLAVLADLLTSDRNGRFARTVVNRIWHRLMGRGIVHPVDVMGNEPWSADLLDYLASYLVEQEYDLRKLIALIVSSEAYQARCTTLSQEEADDRFVFRGPIARRMTAEQLLDAIWGITGTHPGKPAVDFGDRGGAPVRAALVAADPLMRSLGRPNREQVVTTRPDDLTTLQALDLSNGQILASLLQRGAASLMRRHQGATPEQVADWIYRSALARRPSPEEAAILRDILGDAVGEVGMSDALWAVFMLPEFQLIR